MILWHRKETCFLKCIFFVFVHYTAPNHRTRRSTYQFLNVSHMDPPHGRSMVAVCVCECILLKITYMSIFQCYAHNFFLWGIGYNYRHDTLPTF